MITKLLFYKNDYLEKNNAHIGLLLLRIFAGLSMAFAHGVGKIPPTDGFVGFVTSLGLPAPYIMAWMAGITEFVGALLIAVGLLTRPAALGLMGTMAVAAFIAHGADPFAKKELALLYFFVFLAIFLIGPGKFSLDSRLMVKR